MWFSSYLSSCLGFDHFESVNLCLLPNLGKFQPLFLWVLVQTCSIFSLWVPDYTWLDCLKLFSRILEWVAIPFFRGSSRSRGWTQVSCIAGRFFIVWATRVGNVLEEGINIFSCQCVVLYRAICIYVHICVCVCIQFILIIPGFHIGNLLTC